MNVNGDVAKPHKSNKAIEVDVDSDQDSNDEIQEENTKPNKDSKTNKRKLSDLNTDERIKEPKVNNTEKRQKKDFDKKDEEFIMFKNQNGKESSEDETSDEEHEDGDNDEDIEENDSTVEKGGEANKLDDLDDLKVSDEESGDESEEEEADAMPLFDLQSDMEDLTVSLFFIWVFHNLLIVNCDGVGWGKLNADDI